MKEAQFMFSERFCEHIDIHILFSNFGLSLFYIFYFRKFLFILDDEVVISIISTIE